MRSLVSILFLVFASTSVAGTYWVSPTGAASWAAAESATPLSGAACASLTTMRGGSVSAGDTVYFRGGSYNYSDGATLIAPSSSGTSGAKITYSAYDNETVDITNSNVGLAFYAVSLNGKDYIVVDGISFTDFPRHMLIYNGSDYNEIRYCTVTRTTPSPVGGVGRGIQIRGNTTASTHNWIHHNVVANIYWEPCAEGGDGIMIGDTGTDYDSNYNTVEYNTVYHVGHAGTENFTQYNVFRGNYVYNDGFKPFTANLTGTATGGSSTSLIDTTKNFSALGVMSGTFLYIHELDAPSAGQSSGALISSITTTTNPNDTINFSSGGGSPTFSSGDSYSIGCAYFADPTAPGNGEYGHRAFSLDSHSGQRGSAYHDYLLFEGNRAGHAASNPGNDGADGLSLSTSNVIVRFNYFFGNSGPGIFFKNGIVSSYNYVYRNTIYGNGRYTGYQFWANPITTSGIQLTSDTTYNVISNNIFYNNAGGDFDQSLPVTWTSTNNHLNADGDPLFANTDLGTPSSEVLPNLSLTESSPAIDNGTSLTLASGSGSSSTTLIVDDAMFFQDGTWGSSLSDIQPDWIAVGTIGNTVQVSSINYSTNTITLASATSWSDNDNVWLYKDSAGSVVLLGSAPDQGAHEYDPATAQVRRSPSRAARTGTLPFLP